MSCGVRRLLRGRLLLCWAPRSTPSCCSRTGKTSRLRQSSTGAFSCILSPDSEPSDEAGATILASGVRF